VRPSERLRWAFGLQSSPPMADPARLIDDVSGIGIRAHGSSLAERILGGTYRLVRPLARGAMGMIFEAEHLRLHRRVAVKLLCPEFESRPDLLARFRQEAEIVSQLEHPHIVTVLDFDVTEGGEPYLVLELLHGETLEARIDHDAPLALEDVVRIVTQAASALSASHRASIVHRDLKPSNVFLTDAPGEPVFVKLLDFGISKNLRAARGITQACSLLGTPEYMAPEQAMGQNDLVDARTDQYALAVVAYEMLTGVQPFAHGELKEILRRVTKLDPAPPSSIAPWVPAEVDVVLAQALAKDPAKRFTDVMAFAHDFALACVDRCPSAPPSGPRPLGRSSTVSNPPPAPASESASRAGHVARCLERARAALDMNAVEAASTHAEAALELAESADDPATTALLTESENLIAYVFMRRVGSLARRLSVSRALPEPYLPESPRAVFLLSRIDDGMTVGDLLDVAWMPRWEALRWLVRLLSCDAVRLVDRDITGVAFSDES